VRGSLLVRLLVLAALAWVGRWAVLELASYLHRTRPRPAPPPRESANVPGAMPAPPVR
jgi:hypothetical protein